MNYIAKFLLALWRMYRLWTPDYTPFKINQETGVIRNWTPEEIRGIKWLKRRMRIIFVVKMLVLIVFLITLVKLLSSAAY